MSDHSPILSPPPELVTSLRNSAPHGIRDAGVTREHWLINRAYAAGADQHGAVNEAELQKARDQELEACCLLLDDGEHAASYGCHNGSSLRAARRPQLPPETIKVDGHTYQLVK